MSLRRHIPELAVEWARAEPDRPWKRVPGTLCFADISGFTALAERLALRGRSGGEELIETLSRVFATMIDIAHAHGGVLLKFGGDALLLFFDGDDHARRAAGAAVEMRRALRAANTRSSVGPLALSMSVGLHSDDVVFFLVGASHRELIVAGAAATTVIATEGAARSGEILASAATAAQLPATATVAHDEHFVLRWRRSPLREPRPRRAVDAAAESIAALFPRALGRHLATPPEAEHRIACIAFARFGGIDAMLRERGPDAVAAALQATVAVVQDELDRHGVSLLAIDADRDGGKFFLGSGVPFAHEDDEGVMLRALRRIVDRATPLPLQIGVNRGHVFVAEVGARDRAAYSAMGDTTNVAARICAKTPSGAIYAHPSVLDQSLTRFEAHDAGPFAFKGKAQPMLVYAVGAEIGLRQHEGVNVETFVGRTAELAALRGALADPGHVVAVGGAAGIGKSRLLDTGLADARPGTVVRFRAEPYGSTAPFRLLHDPLRRLLGLDGADSAALLRLVGDRATAQLPWASLIGEALGIAVEASPDVHVLQGGFRAERRAHATIALLAALHPDAPLVFVVDDAQWADAASSEWLAHLARECRARRWSLVVAHRDGGGGFRPAADVGIDLTPMTDLDVRRLVELATEAAPLRTHDVDEIVRRAGGNPLFAIEIVRASRDAGSLDAVPETLEATLTSHIDALDPPARKLLRTAAVLGRSFPRGLLETLVDGVDADALARLGDFLDVDAAQIRFRSAMVRDTTYAAVAFRQRAAQHAAAGTALERAQSADVDALALHFSRAGDAPRTWRYARLAAARARASYANADAARYYEMALAVAPKLDALDTAAHVETWMELGDTRELANLFDGSLDAYRRAMRVAGDDPTTQANVLFGRARAKERAGQFTSALRDLTSGLRRVDAIDTAAAAAARARLRSFAAMVTFGQDRPRRAREIALAAAAEARAANERVALGRALIVIDLAQIALDGPGDGAYLEEALAIFESIGDLRMQANVRANLGFLNAHACRWNEAVAWLESGRALDLRTGDDVGGAYAGINIGEILVNQRRYRDAQVLLGESRRAMVAAEFDEGVAFVDIQIARIALARGVRGEAIELMRRTAAEFDRLQKPAFALEATVVLADALIADDATQALDAIDRAARAAGADATFARPKTARVRARALAALGRNDAALAEIDRGLTAARTQRARYDEALLLAARADIGAQNGTDDVERATAIFDELGVVRDREAAVVA
jgi:class 3 adenylate cyclase/tetratricopeptide (TPR) repeat protein